MKIKISINDMYLHYEENCARVDIIAEALGLKPLGEWKKSIDYDTGPLSGSVGETREKVFEADIDLEKLKMFLKGAEYIPLTEEEAKILEDEVEYIGGKPYIKACDLDLWYETKILFMKIWDKYPTARLEVKLKVKGDQLKEYCIKLFRNSIPENTLVKLKEAEKEIIKARISDKNCDYFTSEEKP